jgi:enoyl-CoA hydratase/carnithine racemase
MTPELIKTTQANGVLEICFARPDKRNAITNDMYRLIAEALERAATEPAIRCVLFTHEGEFYCAGNDLMDFAAGAANPNPSEPPQVDRMLTALLNCPKPVVAAVGGNAIGVGATMLLHCDLVYMADDAKLTMPFLNLALVPEAGSSVLLTAQLGHRRAFEVFALGSALSSNEAQTSGLVTALMPKEEVSDKARAACRALCQKPPAALLLLKQLMRDVSATSEVMKREAVHFKAQLKSPEAAEAFQAFMERRPADFTKFNPSV